MKRLINARARIRAHIDRRSAGPESLRVRRHRVDVQAQYCIDTVKRKAAVTDSLLRDRIQADRQIRLSIEDIYNKMPPNGRTVQEYVASAVAAGLGTIPPPTGGGSIGNVVNGDLRVTGRICIGIVDCVPGLPSQIQIAANNGANIYFRSNMDGSQFQSPCTHNGYLDLSNDGGLRLIQNMGFTCAERPCVLRTRQSGRLEFLQRPAGCRAAWFAAPCCEARR